MPKVNLNLFEMILKKTVLIFQNIVQFVNIHRGQVSKYLFNNNNILEAKFGQLPKLNYWCASMTQKAVTFKILSFKEILILVPFISSFQLLFWKFKCWQEIDGHTLSDNVSIVAFKINSQIKIHAHQVHPDYFEY